MYGKNKPAGKTSKNEDRIRHGGSNFGGHSAKGIKHGARGRALEDTEHHNLMNHQVMQMGVKPEYSDATDVDN